MRVTPDRDLNRVQVGTDYYFLITEASFQPQWILEPSQWREEPSPSQCRLDCTVPRRSKPRHNVTRKWRSCRPTGLSAGPKLFHKSGQKHAEFSMQLHEEVLLANNLS